LLRNTVTTKQINKTDFCCLLYLQDSKLENVPHPLLNCCSSSFQTAASPTILTDALPKEQDYLESTVFIGLPSHLL